MIKRMRQLPPIKAGSAKKDASFLNGKGSNDPLVSIIIPCYNDGEFLSECLQSLYTQSYYNIEVIIINDNSTNEKTNKTLNLLSGRVIKRNKITVIKNPINMGPGASRNAGIKSSKGTFILPLDADDKISANFVRDCLIEMLKNEKHIIRGRTRTFGLTNEKIPMVPYDVEYLKTNNLAPCTCMFRRKDWSEIGGYKEDLNDGDEIWEFWVNMAKHGHYMGDCSQSVFWFRKRDGCLSERRSLNKLNCLEKIKSYHGEFYKRYILKEDPPDIGKENVIEELIEEIIDDTDVELTQELIEEIKEQHKSLGESVIEKRVTHLPIDIIVFTKNPVGENIKNFLESLKQTTQNIEYETHIIDCSSSGRNLNVSEKINGYLNSVKGYLIVCAENIRFKTNWLDHALDYIEQNDNVGLVTFHINDTNENVLSNGVGFNGKNLVSQKEHSFDQPVNIMAQFLSCFVIPPTQVRFDERFKRIFYDAVFCWQIWESKKKVVMLPDVIISQNRISPPNKKMISIDKDVSDAFELVKKEWEPERYLKLQKKITPVLLDKLIQFNKQIRTVLNRIVYTVCTGGYDTVEAPRFLEPNTRYIAFTDLEKIKGWEVIPWNGGRRESREPKILAHKYLPEHDESLYIDACIRLTRPPSEIFKMLKSDFAACAHPSDKTLLQHSKTLINGKYDEQCIIQEQIKRYQKAGFQDVAPLTENTFILRRNSKECKKINELWWKEYCLGSNRDQLCLPYVFFKLKTKPQILGFRSRNNVYYEGWWNHNWKKIKDPKERDFLYKKNPNIKKASKKVLMATVVNGDQFEELFSYIEPYHKDYAQKWGFHYKVIRQPKRDWPSPSWWKLDLIEDLKEYEAIFFCDADALPKLNSPNIMNHVNINKFSALNSLIMPYMANENGSTMKSWRKWLIETKKPVDLYIPKKEGFYINGGVWVCYRNSKSILYCEEPVEIDGFLEQHQLCWNLYENQNLYSELNHCWNFGHPHINIEKMRNPKIYILHLNGSSNKMKDLKEILGWDCFKR